MTVIPTVLLISSCGAGDLTEMSTGVGASAPRTTVPGVVSRQAFVDTAKRICKRANDQRNRESITFLERRAQATGEPLGTVGGVELVQEVVVPSLRREVGLLEEIGFPKGKAYDIEALWQTLRIALHEVETEGIYAWRSAKLLPAFRNQARPFGLELCISN